MLTPEQMSEHIGEAEQRFQDQKYAEAYGSVDPVLKSLDESGASAAGFPMLILYRLARLLIKLGSESARSENERSESERSERDQSDERYRQAQHVLDKALKWYPYPNEVKLLNEQGTLYQNRNQYDKALHTFKHVINRELPAAGEDKLFALQGAGASLRELRRYVEAENTFAQGFVQGEEPPARMLIERGWLRFYQKNYNWAFADFERATNLPDADEEDKREARGGQLACRQIEDIENPDKDNERGKKLVNDWLAASQHPISKDEAVKILLYAAHSVHRYLNNYPAVLLACDHVLEFVPNKERAYELKIEALKWLRRFEEAEKEYKSALEKFPTSVGFWWEMGHIYYLRKQFQKALDYFTGAALNERTFPSAQKRDEFANALKGYELAVEWIIIMLRKMRRLDEAEQKVDLALARYGEKVNFLSERAYIYFSRQGYKEAIEIFDRVLVLDEYYEFAHQWRAAAFRKQLKFAEATAKIDHALQKLPAGTGLWDERAWISFDQGELKKADEYFVEAIKLDPYLMHRQLSRVEVLLRLNHSEEARQVLLNLKKQLPGDIELAEQLGWFYLRRGELANAEQEFSSINKRDPNNVLAINGMGGYYLEQRDYKAAERNFVRAINLINYEPQYHLNHALALIRQIKETGETPEAELPVRDEALNFAKASCQRALKLEPHNAKAYVYLGIIAFKRNAMLDAEGYFLKSIELNPNESGHAELGALYVQMGRYEEAKQKLAEAIKRNMNDARAYIEMGNLLLLTESNKEAVRECRRAVSIDPNNDEAHRALAVALMRAGQYDEAEKSLRKAIKHLESPKQWQLHLVLSQILIRLGDENNKDRSFYDEALTHVKKAGRCNPSPNADVFFHEGIVRYKLEDYKSARKNFDDCVKANRDRFEAERYGKLVESMIRQEKRVLKFNNWGGIGMAIFCALMLIVLWGTYFAGWKRAVPASEPAVASSDSNTSQAEKNGAAGKTDAAKAAEKKPEKPLEELVVDKSMLTFMTPLLFGLLVVALLLPNLNKLKLPGGFEAEISELKTKEVISSGPKGEIGFGSSLPVISPGPR